MVGQRTLWCRYSGLEIRPAFAKDEFENTLEVIAGIERDLDLPSAFTAELDPNIRLKILPQIIFETPNRRVRRAAGLYTPGPAKRWRALRRVGSCALTRDAHFANQLLELAHAHTALNSGFGELLR